MGRPPVEARTRIVLAVLAGEVSVAEATRREKVSEQAIGNGKGSSWKRGRRVVDRDLAGPVSH